MWHRIYGVGHQVQDHGLHLGAVYEDLVALGRVVQDELHVLPHKWAQEPFDIAQEGVGIDHDRLAGLPSAEGQQLLGQRGRRLFCRQDLCEIGLLRAVAGDPIPQDLGVAADDLQQVVEVVGDAPG